MISVSEAEQIVLSHCKDFGVETVPFLAARGRVLAENIAADRDLPPYNRVTMDGIAIRFADYEAGCRRFAIAATQAAGSPPPDLPPLPTPHSSFLIHHSSLITPHSSFAIEVMTGAALSTSADTVVPYGNLHIADGVAQIAAEPVRKGQNIHVQGTDRRQGEIVIAAGQVIGPAQIGMAAALGKSEVRVKKLPRVAVLSSGDELVDVADTPSPYQIRRSNIYSTHAALQRYGIDATMLHLPDDPELIRREVARCQAGFDVLLLSGGVSMGKFDYIPKVLEETGVHLRFHKVRQRPGKPFWFGTFGERGLVFALPGNPVSTFMCLHRYVLPWLEASLGFPPESPEFAVLAKPARFEPPLTCFLQVKLTRDHEARLWAEPLEGHGSGDFANLLDADAFLELPMEKTEFAAGEVFRVWRFV
ncbi:MAG: molybdopterin molybdotransferase MoeA [Lewinellaceae bacterium]|nr:molybdopterin molybdotransferase MoeA [Lewinellaceae bacterium]